MPESQGQQPDLSQDHWPEIPRSLMHTSRVEFGDADARLPLQVNRGELPHDLDGHLFIVGPVGFGDAPYGNGTPLFNGDGMIYRLDFDQPGTVWLKSKLVKTPCFYADSATQSRSEYQSLRFKNLGFGRFSLLLGLRNEANTAFVPFKTKQDQHQRLLITYDAGRPFEIDPQSLDVITPVGANAEWLIETPIKFPFSPVLSTAHPGFDYHTQELFTVNYRRSVNNLLTSIPFINALEALPQAIDQILGRLANWLNQQPWLETIRRPLHSLVRNPNPEASGNFVHLVRWDGQGGLERWHLVLPNGSAVVIEQTMHQIGVTRDYIVLADTAFKFGLEQILNNPFPDSPGVERLLRTLLARPQNPETALYIVRRRDLLGGQQREAAVTVVAQKVTIPLELVHFLVDYENPQGRITLHAAHNCASDVSEWLHKFDVSAYRSHPSTPSYLQGMVGSEMDINRLGRYILEGESGKVLESKVIYDQDLTWGVGLYTYRDTNTDNLPPAQIDQIYWQTLGFWPDLLTDFIFHRYEDYRYRAISLTDLLDDLDPVQHRPPSLFRVDTQRMAIADFYEFPLRSKDVETWDSHITSSPQFVPRRHGTDSPTDGYIVCPVISEASKEIWIFDAANLAQGPVCCLGHEHLNFGYTLHTTWLPRIAPRTASYQIPIAEDYGAIVARQSAKIQQLFHQEIYPHFK